MTVPLIETGIGGYQEQPFIALARLYITETAIHAESDRSTYASVKFQGRKSKT